MARKAFNVQAFINGVERPTRVLDLCLDRQVRERVDALMASLAALPSSDDEPLAGNPARERIVAELAELQNAPGWTKFTVQSPTHEDKMRYQVTLADRDAGEDVTDRLTAAEATMIARCVIAIDGNDVSLNEDAARLMLKRWPDDLTGELVTAINDMGGQVVTVPFSQRLSAILTTPEPSDS